MKRRTGFPRGRFKAPGMVLVQALGLALGMALGMALVLVALGGDARADACSDCGPPTRADLEGAAGFKLERHELGAIDEVHLRAGECAVELTGAPKIEKALSWLVIRGSGAVWNCPSGSASDTMTASATQADRRTWSFAASASASVSVLGVGLAAEVVRTVSEQAEIQEVTTISKKMSATWCRVIAWTGWFEVAEYKAEVEFKVRRRFDWWTENLFSGSTVLRSGSVWIDCGTHTAALDARAPIAGYFELKQSPCPDPTCSVIPAKELGFFPPLPAGLPPPVTPGDGETAEGEPDDEPPTVEEPPTAEEPPTVEDEEEVDPIPSSDELGDPPAGVPPHPPGFEPVGEEAEE